MIVFVARLAFDVGSMMPLGGNVIQLELTLQVHYWLPLIMPLINENQAI